MSIRISTCPECGSRDVKVLEEDGHLLDSQKNVTAEVRITCPEEHVWNEHRRTNSRRGKYLRW